MLNLRDVVIFLAGAQTFHTVSHLWLRFAGVLPLRLAVPPLLWTAKRNDGAIVINAVVMVLLYWWLWSL